MEELLEFFGEPTSKDNNGSSLWNNCKLFYSIFCQDEKIYISMVIKEKNLNKPLHYNMSYSSTKQLLVVNGQSLYNVFCSLCLILGIPINGELNVDDLYLLLEEKITNKK